MHIYTGILLCFLVNICAAASGWNYSDPSMWKNDYPNCGMKKQSPINLVNAKCDEALNNSITYTNYTTPGSSKFTLQNNGHTVVLTTSTTGATIKLGGLTFKLAQLHFHWGKDNTKGSEHTMNAKAYPAEMHLVHYNSKYASVTDAKTKTDGLAVLGVFIKAGNGNAAFNFLNFDTNNVTVAGTSVDVDQFAVNGLLPKDTDEFYRYSGSLTTPTCDQTVTWTVFAEPNEMSEAQLAQFRSLKDSHGETLEDNYRPVQALNDREITTWNDDCSGAQSLGASIITAVLFALLFFAQV